MKKIFIGTSGYSYKDWKGIFYPETLPQKDWLFYYSKHFNTVEINATFYRSFNRSVFENWNKKTSKDFCFSIKGSRFITHIKRLKGVENEVARFFEEVTGLGKKLSVVLWQFSPNFKLKVENGKKQLKLLEEFIFLLPNNIRQTFEFRDKSWFKNEVFEILDQNNIGFVINDSSKFSSIEKITGNFAYIRFHGPSALYSSSYSGEELKFWVKKIKDYLKRYDVYCYFNNDVGGYAIENAKELKSFFSKC